MKRLSIFGLISAVLAFLLLQMGIYLPYWKQVFGLLVMILGFLAIVLGFLGLARALISKRDRILNSCFFVIDAFLGSLFGFWGFLLMIPS